MSRGLEVALGAGVLLLAGLIALYGIGARAGAGGGSYTLFAEFDDASGIRPGTLVEIAGVPVGRVVEVTLNEVYFARVRLAIDEGIVVPEDSELAWRQSDLIGAPRLSILVFDAFGEPMVDGDQFSAVDPADNFFELLSNLAGQSDG